MAMQLSGVSGREYWMGGWAVPLGGFCVCSSALLIFSGRVLFGLDLFLNTDVSVLLLLLGCHRSPWPPWASPSGR